MKIPETIEGAVSALDKKELSVGDLIDATLDSIEKWEPKINAFLEVFSDSAREYARELDESDNRKGVLSGVPVAVKDVICTKEGHTTAASLILEKFRSPFDATVVELLKQEGAIIIGKTNQDEFAMGSSNEFSAYGPARNPWDTDRVTGGSSGGSAASVASGEVFASLGTDTGGSVRQPASFCNVVGLKPTYGRVSRFGVIAYGSSLDQVGPITRTVKDNARIFSVIAGQDKRDATTSGETVGSYVKACGEDIAGMKVGLPKDFFIDQVDEGVTKVVSEAVDQLRELGAEVKEVSLPLMHAAVPTYYLVVKSEASSNLARFDGLRYGELELEAAGLLERYLEGRGKYFGPEVKRSILMGTYSLSSGYIDAWYKQASKIRTLIRGEFEQLFENVDILAAPVSPEVAFKIGEKVDDPLAMYLADLLTDPASVAGLPAMSVPCGFSDDLPVGMQLMAPHFKEERLFRAGYAYEQATEWHKKRVEI